MTVTIEIPVELGAALEAAAKRYGVSKDVFVQNLLKEKLHAETTERRASLPIMPRILATNLPVKDRSREHEWLAKNRDQYDGKYVALDASRLVAVAESYKEVAEKALEFGVKDALIVYVEGSNRPPFISGGIW